MVVATIITYIGNIKGILVYLYEFSLAGENTVSLVAVKCVNVQILLSPVIVRDDADIDFSVAGKIFDNYIIVNDIVRLQAVL